MKSDIYAFYQAMEMIIEMVIAAKEADSPYKDGNPMDTCLICELRPDFMKKLEGVVGKANFIRISRRLSAECTDTIEEGGDSCVKTRRILRAITEVLFPVI